MRFQSNRLRFFTEPSAPHGSLRATSLGTCTSLTAGPKYRRVARQAAASGVNAVSMNFLAAAALGAPLTRCRRASVAHAPSLGTAKPIGRPLSIKSHAPTLKCAPMMASPL
ncbi:hypothetical protein G6F50_017622 [Rhizopus delemar]|uniref:Uncharacterized protein n=1 Tax=Rhizopus delemar TaxID=936053 RepID=A0A9P6XQ44_9FUNG|nr:hypothetical protein G6F50_017622 [Rhizopus delemar]